MVSNWNIKRVERFYLETNYDEIIRRTIDFHRQIGI